MQLSWYIAAFYSIQREYVTLVKLCIHATVFGWLCSSPRRNSAAGLREGQRETVSKKCNLGSKYRKREKKHHERIAGKRIIYHVVAALALQALLGACRAPHVLGMTCQAGAARWARGCGPAGCCPLGWDLLSIHSSSETRLGPRQSPQHSPSLGVQCLTWIVLKTEEKLLAVTRVRTREFFPNIPVFSAQF